MENLIRIIDKILAVFGKQKVEFCLCMFCVFVIGFCFGGCFGSISDVVFTVLANLAILLSIVTIISNLKK